MGRRRAHPLPRLTPACSRPPSANPAVFTNTWLGSMAMGAGELIIHRVPLVKHIYSAAKQVRRRCAVLFSVLCRVLSPREGNAPNSSNPAPCRLAPPAPPPPPPHARSVPRCRPTTRPLAIPFGSACSSGTRAAMARWVAM